MRGKYGKLAHSVDSLQKRFSARSGAGAAGLPVAYHRMSGKGIAKPLRFGYSGSSSDSRSEDSGGTVGKVYPTPRILTM